MKRKTNNRLQHLSLSCARTFHLPLVSRLTIVRYRAKPLNEGKNVMKNDILVCLAFSFSLATENWKRKRTGKTNWAMALVCFSHFYSKWQGATSVDSCSVLFSFSRFFFPIFFFFCCVLKAYSTDKVCWCVFPHTKQKEKKKPCRKTGKERVSSSSFLRHF